MRTISQRNPDEAFDATDDMRCMSDALLGDSLDVLEFVVALDRDYGVSIRDGDVGRDVLRDLGTLTRYVLDHGGR
jgi:acyl carrier protein